MQTQALLPMTLQALKRFIYVFAAWTLMASMAWAQNYPNKPIKIISPIPPGGAPDMIARAIGAKLSTLVNQPVVVENKIGSNGNIAAEFVARAPADGYTLLVGMDSLFVINPYLYERAGMIDVNKELIPVATLGANQFVLSLNPNYKFKSLKEFVDFAKKANPPLAYASGGNGSQHHLTMELLKARGGFDMLHVPYKGGTPATTATIGGETMAMFSGTSNANLIRAGKLNALAVSGSQRSKAMPDVPTLEEAGKLKGYEASSWFGLLAPAGTPSDIVLRIQQETAKALNVPAIKEKLLAQGAIPSGMTPDEFVKLIDAEHKKWAQVVKASGARVD